MDDSRTLLRDLVENPSISGREEPAAAVLVDWFEEAGREVFVDDVGNVRAPMDDSVLLTSHIDTVAGDIPVREEDGMLWGRGSVDAKGPLAAMAAAAVETEVSFVGVVEEETTSRGARSLVENRDAPDAVVNGEPSGWDGIVLGYRGFLAGTYSVTVPSAHTALAESNAIQKATDWWTTVAGEFESAEEGPAFEQVTAKPISFDGGTSDDGLATEATVEFQIRLPPGVSETDAKAVVGDATSAGTVEWEPTIHPVMESPRTSVARALRAGIRASDGEPTHLRKTGTSDMNVFAEAWDVPMATYGPGDSSLDHAPDERIDLAEFDRAVEVLTHAATSLAAE